MHAAQQARLGGRFAPPSEETIAEAGRRCYWDRENDEQIARRLGISRRTLARWKHHPAFIAARAKASAEYSERLRREFLERSRAEMVARMSAIPTGKRRRRRT